MESHFKKIHIGSIIRQKTIELEIKTSRICSFIKCTEKEVEEIFESVSLDTEIVLRWSKLLKYDLFRVYNQHLILYSPPRTAVSSDDNKAVSPEFKKHLYTVELIDFILEQIQSGQMTKLEVMKEYGIPKTTLYKWISKYKKVI